MGTDQQSLISQKEGGLDRLDVHLRREIKNRSWLLVHGEGSRGNSLFLVYPLPADYCSLLWVFLEMIPRNCF